MGPCPRPHLRSLAEVLVDLFLFSFVSRPSRRGCSQHCFLSLPQSVFSVFFVISDYCMYSLCPTVNKSAIVLLSCSPGLFQPTSWDSLFLMLCLLGARGVFGAWPRSEAELGTRRSLLCPAVLPVNLP